MSPAGIRDAEPAADRVGVAAFILALRGSGVRDLAVLRAFERVPRAFYAPDLYADLARSGVALPLPLGQTMTTPTVIATMLVALGVEPDHRVLEVGTGSGYVTALLSELGGNVRSVERRPSLCDAAATRFSEASVGGVELVCGDAFSGSGGGRVFDRIILNGSVPDLPDGFADRLAPGGRLVAGIARGGAPRLFVSERDGDGRFAHAFGPSLRIAPLDVKAGTSRRNGSLT